MVKLALALASRMLALFRPDIFSWATVFTCLIWSVVPNVTLASHVLQIANFLTWSLAVKNFCSGDMFVLACGECARGWDVFAFPPCA